MGWVKDAMAELSRGRTVTVSPQGGRSVAGRIDPGQTVTLAPVQPGDALAVDEAVLVRWQGHLILHLVKEVGDDDVLIGNSLGKINGRVPRRDVVARVVSVTPASPDQASDRA